jgi:hypothetical protein
VSFKLVDFYFQNTAYFLSYCCIRFYCTLHAQNYYMIPYTVQKKTLAK